MQLTLGEWRGWKKDGPDYSSRAEEKKGKPMELEEAASFSLYVTWHSRSEDDTLRYLLDLAN